MALIQTADEALYQAKARRPQPRRLRQPGMQSRAQSDRVGRIRGAFSELGDRAFAAAKPTSSVLEPTPRSGYDRGGLGSRARHETDHRSNERKGRPCRRSFPKRLIDVLPPLSLGVCSWSLQVKSIAELKGFLDQLGVNVVQIACGDPHHASWDEGETCRRRPGRRAS